MRKLSFAIAACVVFALLAAGGHALTCGGACVTAADVAADSSKCLFIYNQQVYQPPASTISGGMHKGIHVCGADVTGIMAQSHLNNPSHYLTPYVCAPLCNPSTQPACTDADSDGYAAEASASACNGLCNGAACKGYGDCNDHNASIHPGATEVCNGVDDNCNGQIDEGLSTPQSITCGVGACQVSVTQSCVNGVPTPACVPKAAAPAEICGNGIDDNCDGQIDEGCACVPGKTISCGSDVGICKKGIQTCRSDKQYGDCVGGVQPLSGEICGNGLDDDCDGVIDNGCPEGNNTIYSIYSQPPLPPAPQFTPIPLACLPKCDQHCGQSNGCGGACPNDEKYLANKCGNPACKPSCAQRCGQGDGCGGNCSANDTGVCGTCGNPPCCIATELCGDNIDNNCDGRVDENCGIIPRLLGIANPPADPTKTSLIDEIGLGVTLAKKASIFVRISGLVSFFFAGLTLIIGIFRFELINRFSRAEVIKYHALVGFFSVFFITIHILGAIFDVPGWGDTIMLKNALWPTFVGTTLTGVAWGVIGMYLLLITMLTGIFFMRMARKMGYKAWLFMHRLSFAFYGFIFYHALAIGSDFANWYIRIFFGTVLAIIFIYVLKKTYKNKKIADNVKALAARIGLHPASVTISELVYNDDYVGKKITTSGTASRLPAQQAVVEEWWIIHGENESVFALMPPDTKPDFYIEITGDLKKAGQNKYIDVTKLKRDLS